MHWLVYVADFIIAAHLQMAVPLVNVNQTEMALSDIPVVNETLSSTLPAASFTW